MYLSHLFALGKISQSTCFAFEFRRRILKGNFESPIICYCLLGSPYYPTTAGMEIDLDWHCFV
jgi:hypothetical protein